MKIEATKGWSTHMPTLIKKDVLEMGAGYFSTPLLHWVCKYKNIKVMTYENEPEFFKFARTFQSRLHRIRLINNWDNLRVDRHWGLVFIDHSPDNRRGIDAVRLKDNADYIIIHDSERKTRFGYGNIWQYFKYRYNWKDGWPWTTVLSNFKDLKRLSL